MDQVHVIAHTHWDFEWYFTRQHARVQFAYHMQEVLYALETNQLRYYLLDGAMAIVDDYLETHPDKRPILEKFVKSGHLYVGPWYTQIDEMVTSGESIVHNLQLGFEQSRALGDTMMVGYLPDSFGQGQDMPKIYNGFGIENALFWRGRPKEKDARYFYWTSEDESKVLVANIQNGYYAGTDLVESDDQKPMFDRITTDTDSTVHVLPVGGDQRAVDFNLQERIEQVNDSDLPYHLTESHYPAFFQQLREEEGLPTFDGEFVDASFSKIHRGIYSSRADLKKLYDELENLTTFVVEPLMAIAKVQGIETESGIVSEIWKTVAQGQAHDSSGGCNSDITNQDIFQRGQVALQLAESLRDYLLRKLTSGAESFDVVGYNTLPTAIERVWTFKVSTKSPIFELRDSKGQTVSYQVIEQIKEDAAVVRHDPSKQTPEPYYRTTLAVQTTIPSLDWVGFTIDETKHSAIDSEETTAIENDYYHISVQDHQVVVRDKQTDTTYENFITFEDGGDEGDNYDFSPAYDDWIINLNFDDAKVNAVSGELESRLTLTGTWRLPKDLDARRQHVADQELPYELTLTLKKADATIGYRLNVDNTVKDHRLRLVMHTPIQATHSVTDTPFGIIERPVEDPHLNDWREIGYVEEPTALRPFLHFTNTHDDKHSVSFIGCGEKVGQLIGDHFSELAITMFRSVGYLGRPDLTRRLGDASGLVNRYVETPDSQLLGRREMIGGIRLEAAFDPVVLQNAHHALVTDGLFYQNQTIDRFTDPLRYFMINNLPQPLAHHPLFQLDSDQLVVSLVTGISDKVDSIARVYNPHKHAVDTAGTLCFAKDATLCLMNLNHDKLELLGSDLSEYALESFKPGEIRTYGIDFKH